MVTMLTCICKNKAELFVQHFLHGNGKHNKAKLANSRHLSMNSPLFIPVATSALLIHRLLEVVSLTLLRTDHSCAA